MKKILLVFLLFIQILFTNVSSCAELQKEANIDLIKKVAFGLSLHGALLAGIYKLRKNESKYFLPSLITYSLMWVSTSYFCPQMSNISRKIKELQKTYKNISNENLPKYYKEQRLLLEEENKIRSNYLKILEYMTVGSIGYFVYTYFKK